MAVRTIQQGRRPVLDDLDKSIIKCLQLDGRRPYARIGRELKVPEATVRQRAERLIEGKGIPLHFRGAVTAILDWLGSLPATVSATGSRSPSRHR